MTQRDFNPYVGPRPFERNARDVARFFGRSQETKEITSLIFGHPVVLVYAQSGAGKTSLFNTSIALTLENKGFDVLPLTRVGGVVPNGISPQDVKNLYVFNALLKIDTETDPQKLLSTSLSDFLDKREMAANESGQPHLRAIIFDQFEELFTYTPTRWHEQRSDFFHQVVDAIKADPLLRVVFVIREDFLAELDPYARDLPERLRIRYRLERLGEGAALRSIKDPLANTSRRFAPGVAEELVRELLATRSVDATGKMADIEGQYVEPVQLQVVGVTLWSTLEPNCIEIQKTHLQNFNVNDALSNFYNSAIEDAVKATGVREANLRDWFGKTLITSMGTRSTVFRGEESTGGIDNRAVDFLESRHIIRAEFRAGARWYELTHDRLVGPILEDNKKWFASNTSLLQQQATLWHQENRRAGLLFLGRELAEAEEWVLQNPDEVSNVELDFLNASKTLRRQRRVRFTTIITTLILMIFLTGYAVKQREKAQNQERIAQLTLQTFRNKDFSTSLLFGIEFFKLVDNSLTRSILLDNAQVNPYLQKYLAIHKADVYSVAFSPDGKVLASGSKDQTIVLWDTESYKPIGERLMGHKGSVTSVTFSQDGSMLASGSVDKSIILWNVKEHRQIGQLEGEQGPVYSVAFSPNGKLLASGGADGSIILWDVESQQPITKFPKRTREVLSVAFSPDGSTLASGSADGTIILWDVESYQPIGFLIKDSINPNIPNAVTSVVFSPDGSILASASTDITITLWDWKSRQLIDDPLTGHEGYITDIAFSPDGKTLVSSSIDRTLILWNVDSHIQVGEPLKGHSNWVRSVAFNPDGHTIASGGSDSMVIVWDLDIMGKTPLGQSLKGQDYDVYSVAIEPDGETIASGSVDGKIILWDVTTGKPFEPLLTESNTKVNSVVFSPDGKTLASGLNDGSVILWDVDSHRVLGRLDGDGYGVYCIAFSPDGTILATGNSDNSITLWDMESRQQTDQLNGHTGAVNSIAFSPDGKILASGSSDFTIVLWSVETKQPVGEPLKGDQGVVVYSIAFSPDGIVLFSGGSDFRVYLWDVIKHQPIGSPLASQNGFIYSLAVSPDGRTLATGSYKNSIQLWDIENIDSPSPFGEPLMDNTLTVTSLAFTPDGKSLISGGANGSVIVWNLDPSYWIEKACQRVGRNFSQAEWSQYFQNQEYRATCPPTTAFPEDLPLFINTPSISTSDGSLISPTIEVTSELLIPNTGGESTPELLIPNTGGESTSESFLPNTNGEGTFEFVIPNTGGEGTPEPVVPVAVPSSSSNYSDNEDKFQELQIPVTGFLIPVTGFAPNVVTSLSNFPHETYINTSIMLEIPSLSISIPIVGVPLTDGTWNVSWLGDQAGWLEGSAFPSWSGNSVLTGHVYLSTGKPGPFAKLHELQFGDQILVNAYGQRYTFEVQTKAIVAPTDRSVMKHEDLPWLTLVTCANYDFETESYTDRLIVRAVLVKISEDG